MKAVIMGAGESGVHLARRLTADDVGADVVLVDRDPEALKVAEEVADVLTMAGDITHFQVQRRAGVAKADLVVALTGSDETNMVAAGLAAQAGALRTMARADSHGLYRSPMAVEVGALGIGHLLCASRLVDRELRRLIRACHADWVEDFASYTIRTLLLTVTDSSPVLGRSAAGARVAGAEHIAAVVRDRVVRPPGEIARLESGDQLLLVGSPADISHSQHQLLGTLRKRRAVLIGGGDVGAQLAATLCKTERRVLVVERDAQRCQQLAELLPQASVVQGDGTSIALLTDQQIHSADYVLAVTRSDEANLMASLLSRDLGVKHTFSIVHRHGYADVYAHLGVHGTAGPHEVVAKTVLSLLPEGGVMARWQLPDCSHEVVEYQLDAGTRDLTVEGLAAPPGCILLAVARDHQFLRPTHNLALQGRDHLLFAQPHHARKEMLKRLAKVSR